MVNAFTSRYKAKIYAESNGLTDYVIVKHGEVYQLYINLELLEVVKYGLQEISKKSE